jgi:hypothetical protein
MPNGMGRLCLAIQFPTHLVGNRENRKVTSQIAKKYAAKTIGFMLLV